MVTGPSVEILDDGRGEPRPVPMASWLRAHRVVVGVLAAACLAAGAAAVRVAPRDDWPTVTVVTAGDQAPTIGDPWQAGTDGRPSTPVTLSLTVAVQRRPSPRSGGDGADAQVRVLGLAGPGISHDDGPAVEVPSSGELVEVPLSARVDCAEVPRVVPGDAYGLRVQRGAAARRRTRVVSAGAAGAGWGRAVQLACATWTARSTLTVTTLTAHPHPTLPRVDVTMTVTNTGSRDATLDRVTGWSSWIRIDGDLPLHIPAHGAAEASVAVQLSTCDAVSSGYPPTAADVAETSTIGLVALTGPAPSGDLDLFGTYGEGTGPTGVVLSGPAGTALRQGLSAVCGDLGPLVVIVPEGGVRFDERTRDLAVDVLIDVTPGRVRSITLRPGPATDPLVVPVKPRWTQTRQLLPDPTGQVRTTLHFDLGGTPSDCAHSQARGPRSIPGLLATLVVPTDGAERVLSYAAPLDITGDRVGRLVTCVRADLAS